MTAERAVERLLEMQRNCAKTIQQTDVPQEWKDDFKERLEVFDVAIAALRQQEVK